MATPKVNTYNKCTQQKSDCRSENFPSFSSVLKKKYFMEGSTK